MDIYTWLKEHFAYLKHSEKDAFVEFYLSSNEEEIINYVLDLIEELHELKRI